MDSHPEVSSTRSGKGTLVLLLVLVALGSLAASVAGYLGRGGALGEPAWGALGGWLGAGLLGVCGWWTNRKALSGGSHRLLKYLVGGMLVRLLICGLGTGLVVGMGWLDTHGFILGLLVGLAVFWAVEIGGLYKLSPRSVGS